LRRGKLRVHHTQEESSQIDHALTDHFHQTRVGQVDVAVEKGHEIREEECQAVQLVFIASEKGT